MSKEEIKTMMLSYYRLQAKSNKSAMNVMTLNDMFLKMPEIIEDFQAEVQKLEEQAKMVTPDEAELKTLRAQVEGYKLTNTDQLHARIAELEFELAAKTCEWKYEADNHEYPQDEDDFWNTGCGHAYRFIEDGPKENGIEYCMYCGGKVVLPPLPEKGSDKEQG